ncbi:hypothetical protein V6N13_049398 [Hibiscus sabdariffa]|uniref:Uncharacterized protein n=1 Tax=Hibiscus sabdariffa TaxID=183260 RepID=A0ABR2QXE4_9ROSI
MFSIMNDDFGYVSLMIERDELERNGSCEDLRAHEMVPSIEETSHGIDQGLHLVHLLVACTEAIGCRVAMSSVLGFLVVVCDDIVVEPPKACHQPTIVVVVELRF